MAKFDADLDARSTGHQVVGRGLWFFANVVLLPALVLTGLVAAWVWFQQETLLFKPLPLAANTVLATTPDVKEVVIEVEGARLSALHLKRDGAKGLVFFLHGNAGNLQTWFVNIDGYRQANFDLFMPDYRGYGKSTGEITSERQLRGDVRAAYAAVAPQYAGRKVVIYGRSLGTALAAGLAAELANDESRAQPDLTVLVSPYQSMLALAADVYPYVPQALLRYPLRTDAAVGGIKSPLLLFHGSNDSLIAPSHSAALKALAPKAELVLIEDAGHNNVQTFAAYRARFFAALAAL